MRKTPARFIDFSDGGPLLGDLSDVDLSGLADGQVATFDAAQGIWKPSDVLGGSSSLGDLVDVDTTTVPPSIGSVLKFDGSAWTPGTDEEASGGGSAAGLFRGAWSTATARLVDQFLTSNTAPAPYAVTVSRQETGDEGWRLFDNNATTTKWRANVAPPVWAAIDLGGTKRLARYSLSARGNESPLTWKIQGSTDGTTWLDVDSRADESFGAAGSLTATAKSYTLAAPASFRHFRLYLPSQSNVPIYDWTLFDETDPYMLGEYVTHRGRLWRSISDNNAGEPAVTGWTEIPVGYYPPGPTSSRPQYPTKGPSYFDETLGKPIWWNGSAWRDASGAAV